MNRSTDYKDLTSYIISLPKGVIEKIFDHPTTCLAIFRLNIENFFLIR